jgi:hypothetical protein
LCVNKNACYRKTWNCKKKKNVKLVQIFVKVYVKLNENEKTWPEDKPLVGSYGGTMR